MAGGCAGGGMAGGWAGGEIGAAACSACWKSSSKSPKSPSSPPSSKSSKSSPKSSPPSPSSPPALLRSPGLKGPGKDGDNGERLCASDDFLLARAEVGVFNVGDIGVSTQPKETLTQGKGIGEKGIS